MENNEFYSTNFEVSSNAIMTSNGSLNTEIHNVEDFPGEYRDDLYIEDSEDMREDDEDTIKIDEDDEDKLLLGDDDSTEVDEELEHRLLFCDDHDFNDVTTEVHSGEYLNELNTRNENEKIEDSTPTYEKEEEKFTCDLYCGLNEESKETTEMFYEDSTNEQFIHSEHLTGIPDEDKLIYEDYVEELEEIMDDCNEHLPNKLDTCNEQNTEGTTYMEEDDQLMTEDSYHGLDEHEQQQFQSFSHDNVDDKLSINFGLLNTETNSESFAKLVSSENQGDSSQNNRSSSLISIESTSYGEVKISLDEQVEEDESADTMRSRPELSHDKFINYFRHPRGIYLRALKDRANSLFAIYNEMKIRIPQELHPEWGKQIEDSDKAAVEIYDSTSRNYVPSHVKKMKDKIERKKYIKILRNKANSLFTTYNEIKNKISQRSFPESKNELGFPELFKKTETSSLSIEKIQRRNENPFCMKTKEQILNRNEPEGMEKEGESDSFIHLKYSSEKIISNDLCKIILK